ncbi:hypothetical protein ACJX0J_007139 [Zea mays]
MIACVHAIYIIIHDLLSHRIMPNKILRHGSFGVAQIPLPLASCITIDKFHLHAGLKGSNRCMLYHLNEIWTLTHEVNSCNLQMLEPFTSLYYFQKIIHEFGGKFDHADRFFLKIQIHIILLLLIFLEDGFFTTVVYLAFSI